MDYRRKLEVIKMNFHAIIVKELKFHVKAKRPMFVQDFIKLEGARQFLEEKSAEIAAPFYVQVTDANGVISQVAMDLKTRCNIILFNADCTSNEIGTIHVFTYNIDEGALTRYLDSFYIEYSKGNAVFKKNMDNIDQEYLHLLLT